MKYGIRITKPGGSGQEVGPDGTPVKMEGLSLSRARRWFMGFAHVKHPDNRRVVMYRIDELKNGGRRETAIYWKDRT